MRIVATIVVATGLLVPGASARAQTDCEPARCAAQAAINAECSCTSATNHGQYVSCVAHVVKRLSLSGAIPTNCKGKVKRCAARSTCGKAGFVTCSFTVAGTCDLTTLTCVGNSAVPCTSDLQCATTRCKIKSSDAGCMAAGGTVGTSATCCANCTP